MLFGWVIEFSLLVCRVRFFVRLLLIRVKLWKLEGNSWLLLYWIIGVFGNMLLICSMVLY